MSSESPPTESEKSPEPKKRRSPVERALVWGAIAGMLVIVVIEGRARVGYSRSLSALQTTLADNDEARLTLAEARQMMVLGPTESGPVERRFLRDEYRYSWFSLFKRGQYDILLTASQDDEPQVLTFATVDAPPDPPLTPLIAAPGGNGMAMANGSPGGGMFPGGGMGPSGGFGPGGGSPPPVDPLVKPLDSDSDGAISTDELENASAALLALDADGDGQLTREELFPGGPPVREGAGNGEPSNDEPGRPQRPESEESTTEE